MLFYHSICFRFSFVTSSVSGYFPPLTIFTVFCLFIYLNRLSFNYARFKICFRSLNKPYKIDDLYAVWKIKRHYWRTSHLHIQIWKCFHSSFNIDSKMALRFWLSLEKVWQLIIYGSGFAWILRARNFTQSENELHIHGFHMLLLLILILKISIHLTHRSKTTFFFYSSQNAHWWGLHWSKTVILFYGDMTMILCASRRRLLFVVTF